MYRQGPLNSADAALPRLGYEALGEGSDPSEQAHAAPQPNQLLGDHNQMGWEALGSNGEWNDSISAFQEGARFGLSCDASVSV